MRIVAVAVAALAAHVAVSSAQSPPFWGPVWTAPFNQTITISKAFQWSNMVNWQYDSTTKPVGSSLYQHGAGQHDELCTSVVGKEFSSEPCNLLASTDTWRYVIFPDSNECCRACNTTGYCGIVSPDWLQTNSSYQGRKTIAGLQCDGWLKVGGEQNFWYAEVNTQQPCQYYEGYPVLPITSNYWNFFPDQFNRNPIPASTFAVPAGCTQMCQTSSIPYEERLERRWRAGLPNLVKLDTKTGQSIARPTQEMEEQAAAATLSASPSDMIQFAASQANATIVQLATPTSYPGSGSASTGGPWVMVAFNNWVSSFFTGTLWKLYQLTGQTWWRDQAILRIQGIMPEQFDTTTHDVGFMIGLSFGLGADVTGNATMRAIANRAAQSLATRFNPKVGCFRSWNGGHFQVIIDNMMNLELIWQAWKATGNQTLFDMASSHANVMLTTSGMLRPDGCSYHLVDFDPNTGAVLSRSSLPQGFSNDSIWSRGQAWAIYGFAMSHRYTGNAAYLNGSQWAAQCFLTQLQDCCSADSVPLWDFDATGVARNYRDTSAAAIASAGLLELASFTTDPALRTQYLNAASAMLSSLSAAPYRGNPSQTAAVLLHGMGDYPVNEVDVPLIYGDYYYLEAAMRLAQMTQ